MEEVANTRTQKRKRHNSDKGAFHLPLVVKDSIKHLFERKFVYDKPNDDVEDSIPWTPLFKTEGTKATWEIPDCIAMKHELNDLKNNLNDKNMVTWHDHTRSVNLAGFISQQIKAKFRPEMCTQAWCKFYEVASTYLQIDMDSPFFSVHLCEAPGAFVTSLNQYLLSKGFKSNWYWMATTLNPYYEGNSIRQMIDDDRFIRGSHGNWYFGVDGTGNLMSMENLSGLVQKLQDTTVNLVTADGSIDCQDDPAEQENVVCRLQYCEVVTAMHILSPGGTLVVKMFTLFECRAICLMYLLNCVFDQVNVFKPCTSKGGNSEVYVVCQGYRGKEYCKSYLSILTEKYFGDSEPEGCIFDLSDLPESFLDQHVRCAGYFKDCQMTSIQRNLDLFRVAPEVMTEVERSRLEQEKEYCMECFFSRYHIEPMVGKARIMRSNKRLQRRPEVIQPEQKPGDFADKIRLEGKFTGSFQERKRMLQSPWKQKVFQYETFEEEVSVEDNSLWIRSVEGPLLYRELEGLTLQLGRRVDRIHSSRFCHNYYIAQTQEILDNVQWLENMSETSPELTEMIVTHLLTVLTTALQCTDPGAQLINQSSFESTSDNSAFISWKNWPDSNTKLSQETHTMDEDSVNNCLKETDSNGNCSIPSQDQVSMATEISKADNDQDHVTVTSGSVDCDTPMADSDRIIVGKGSEIVTESGDASANSTADIAEQGKLAIAGELAASEDTTGLLNCCLKCYCNNGHSDVCSKLKQAAKGTGATVWLYSVSSDHVAGDFEITEQKELCEAVLDIVKTCGRGDTVVVEMGTSLSRVTAGLVYFLYRSFLEIGFVHHHGNLLRRHLVCVSYQHCPAGLHQYLTDALEKMSLGQTEAVLELVPVFTMLEDTEFTSFLHISNTNLLQSFITTVVNREKQLYTDDQTHSDVRDTSVILAT